MDDASNNFIILLLVPEKIVEDKIIKELSDRYKIEKINDVHYFLLRLNLKIILKIAVK